MTRTQPPGPGTPPARRIDATYAAGEARRRLADLVRQVARRGDRVLITRRGRPVAAVVCVGDLRVLDAWEDLQDVAALAAMDAEAEETRTLPAETPPSSPAESPRSAPSPGDAEVPGPDRDLGASTAFTVPAARRRFGDVLRWVEIDGQCLLVADGRTLAAVTGAEFLEYLHHVDTVRALAARAGQPSQGPE